MTTTLKEELDRFEAYVMEYTGRDMDYHRAHNTQNMDLACACWIKANIDGENRLNMMRSMVSAMIAAQDELQVTVEKVNEYLEN